MNFISDDMKKWQGQWKWWPSPYAAFRDFTDEGKSSKWIYFSFLNKIITTETAYSSKLRPIEFRNKENTTCGSFDLKIQSSYKLSNASIYLRLLSDYWTWPRTAVNSKDHKRHMTRKQKTLFCSKNQPILQISTCQTFSLNVHKESHFNGVLHVKKKLC